MADFKPFSEILKSKRLSREESAVAFASSCGILLPAYCEIENGHRFPSREELDGILGHLDDREMTLALCFALANDAIANDTSIAGCCQWVWSEITYDSECGGIFQFNVDGPTENGFRFCPYCGKSLIVSHD